MKSLHRFLLALVVGILFVGSFSIGLFRGPENALEDRLFSPKKVDPSILIAAIDNKSIASVGQWPWKRAVYAELFRELKKAGVTNIALDVMLAEPSRLGPADDATFAHELDTLSIPVVLPEERIAGLKSLALFTNHPLVSTGHVDYIIDPDGVVRRIDITESFVRKVLTQGAHDVDPVPTVKRIAFAGPPGIIPSVSISDILAGTKTADLAGKTVFIGSTAPDLHDSQNVPTSNGQQMNGVEIQAQVYNMLKQGYALEPLTSNLMSLWILLAALIPVLAFRFFPRSVSALGATIVIGIVYIVAGVVLFDRGIVIDFVHLTLSWVVSTAALFAHRYFFTEKERREMRHAFSKYVSKDILEEILNDPTKVQLGGVERDATVFFSDVRGFTTLSEQLTAKELVTFLNQYLTIMTDIALDTHGVVDKYIGDAIMAFWGAPLPTPTHARDAIRASLRMIDALHEFNKASTGNGNPSIDIGIGLNSGDVIAGNMGSTNRFDYTVMGDTVTLASRLEGQTKTYGVHIIASENTIAKISENDRAEESLLFRELDKIKVKGKKLPVTIFEVVESTHQEKIREILPDFAAALTLYYAGSFAAARSGFEQILTTLPSDAPSRLLFDRCTYFIEHPPVNWDGVYEFKTK